MDAELKNLMNSAAHEIRDLRRRNEVLTAKVEVMDLFACVLHTKAASRSEGMTEDVAWLLDRKVRAMAADEPNAEAAP